MAWSAVKTMNTNRERWIVEWGRYQFEPVRSPVYTAFFKREHVRRHLAKLQADPIVRSISVKRVVPVVRWNRGNGTAIEQLDAFPLDEVQSIRWILVWVPVGYPGPPRMPPSTRFQCRESLRQRVSELEQLEYVTHIYVTHLADVLYWWDRSEEDVVERFDAFVQRSSLTESHQPGSNPSG